jgi:hypothetical protein
VAFSDLKRPGFGVLEAQQTPEQQAEERRRRAVAAAVAGGTLVVVGEPDGSPAQGVPSAAARAAAAGTILSGLVAYLATQRARMRSWLGDQLRRRAPSAGVDDIAKLIAEEERRQQSFEQKQAERFARDLTVALAIPDPVAREAAVRGLTQREKRYAAQRDEAMAARAFAAVDRVVLRGQSPAGAFWKLDPNVVEHTAGCLIMGGKFWPWQVLDRVHPPRHAGCPCRLIGYGEAIADGLLAPGNVTDVRTAVRRAAAVVMEGVLILAPDDAEALIEDAGGEELLSLRQALVEAGLVGDEGALDEELTEAFNPKQARYPKGHPRAGQWRPKIATGSTGNRSSDKWLARDVEELKILMRPEYIGTVRRGDGPEEPQFRARHSTAELQAVGRRVASMAERYGTHHAYRERIKGLHEERRALMEKKAQRIEEAGGHAAVMKKARGAAMGTGKSITETMDSYATPEERARIRALDVEVADLLVREAEAKRDAVAGVLAQVREMGGRLRTGKVEGHSGGLAHGLDRETVAKHEASLREVEKLLPAQWIADANAKGKIDYILSKDRAWHRLDAGRSRQDDTLDTGLQKTGTMDVEPAFVGYLDDGRPVFRNGYGAVQAVDAEGRLEMLRTDGDIENVPGVTKAERRIPQRKMDSTIRVDAGDTSTLLHEVGHRMELAVGETHQMTGLPPVLAATLRFLAERKGNKPARKLKDIYPKSGYDEWETAWEDKFVDAYIGKDYGGRVTEVLTMGLQGIFFPVYSRRFDPPAAMTTERSDLPMRDFMLGLLAGV